MGFDVLPDLDLRLVRYLTVVVEHLNFARAAEELRVAQPSLSRGTTVTVFAVSPAPPPPRSQTGWDRRGEC
ncbi:LysR family transcriptional regulator [Micromonospora profundi]|uniref:LysR family transcriptional regulator n=1 Tax=Micromonospora profundi TaxID=1420889 RepID=UPI003655168C